MDLLENTTKAYLLLADGTVFEGLSMGVPGTTVGEVVFTTGMTAYEETLTDPSYYGQIITQTFPLIGNYGVNEEDVESARVYAKGYIVREKCERPSNFRCDHTLDWFLKKQNVVGIYHIDTRALTRRIREQGVMNGMITTENVLENKEAFLAQVREFSIRDAVKNVTIGEPKVYPCGNARFRVALYDFGYKRNIRRSLLQRNCEVTILPAGTPAAKVREMGFDGVMLSNGPGDPAEAVDIIENLKKLGELDIPVFGICLGHQLLALAHGAKTAKLKYGHRGANQPVIDLAAGRTYVTSQNHGYEVLGDTLAGAGRVSHLNGNDRSCEGVEYGEKMFTVQFHPEACGGPTDTSTLFDRFITMMEKQKEGC